jgi:type VI secretion system protein ImpK
MSYSDIRGLSFDDDFQDFYTEVIRLRALAESGVLDGSPADGDASESQVQTIRTRLINLMERGSLFAGRNAGEIGFGLHREVQYVMASLADETFLHLQWHGADYWTSHLLEAQLFNSHNAGEEFFTRLDRLLDQPERSYTDIYSVYLMALALGFRGKYWGVDDGGRIESYRRRLFVRIYRRRPELFAEGARLFPQSYRHTLDEGVARKLPSPLRWFGALALAIVLWVAISGLLWRNLTVDIEANVARIKSAKANGSAAGSAAQGRSE